MRVLLLHPEDDSIATFMRKGPWDAIFDLGAGGRAAPEFSRPVRPIPKAQFADLRSIKKLFARGIGRIIDSVGFDWWDLISVEFYEPVLELLRLQRFVQASPPQAQFCITRAGFQSRLLQALCPGRVHVSVSRFPTRLREKARRGLRLRSRQIVQILADKYDGDYKVRRFLSHRHRLNSTPVVLLPSAYGNASRMALAYAEALPDIRFLLVATRQSGWVNAPPANVICTLLAAFASGTLGEHEFQHLLAAWRGLAAEFNGETNLALLARAGCFDSVPDLLRQGLAIRNAWVEVFASQPVASVLCADEMNWHTSLPLLIARSRNLPAVACHHGALDLRYSFHPTSADRFLAKGTMERDYLVEACGMDEEKIEIAAPPVHAIPAGPGRESIVFFSEPYEAFGGRSPGYYQQLLPPLANLAHKHNCELVLKLHPFESRRERTRLASDLLSANLRRLVRIVDGPLDDELMGRAWFGVTVTSSAAVDCAMREVPAFLCQWLDFSPNRYADQFVQFGAAKALAAADEIPQIPDMLKNFARPDLQSLWQTAEPDRLRKLILGYRETRGHARSVECAWV